MTDGGSGGDSANGTGLFARLRRHRLIASAAVVTVLAAAAAVPVALAGTQDPPCWRLPGSARDLAGDPAAATEALDPGEDLGQLGAARKLLRHERVCGDGARVLGRVVTAATRSSGPGEPHTIAQARSAYAVATALDGTELPHGLARGVAGMLAEYVVDAGRGDQSYHDQVHRPALPASAALPGPSGYTWLGRFLAPGEAHVTFGYADATADAEPDVPGLVAELAKDPEAFAVLYDAERAYFAYYLERLTRRGGDPGHRSTGEKYESTATTWPDNDLQDLGERVGDLMKYRAEHARDGAIPDLAAFDAAVREHTRGAFRPAARRLDSREPMGDIADRPVAGPVKGPLMDGRHQLLGVLADWAEQRNVPEARAEAMRQLIDDGYVRGLWLTI